MFFCGAIFNPAPSSGSMQDIENYPANPEYVKDAHGKDIRIVNVSPVSETDLYTENYFELVEARVTKSYTL